jgi:type II secretory pathway pseudopilin PulG
MKTKGFTLIELVVACTLLILLSTVATTSTYNFVQATANLKAQSNSIHNIMLLHGVLANAKMNYATDLAFVLAAEQAVLASDPTSTDAQNKITSIQTDIADWNSFAQQNNNRQLINLLINPDPALPIPHAPLNPGSRSYLPTSRIVPLNTYSNGNPVTTPVLVQITDINSLLQAYQLTDDGTPTGNTVATISVGPILQVTSSGTVIRPMLPIIDWKSGTPEEIQY